MNDVGSNWYFLVSGRLSILKPNLYDNIKISYECYFKYLLALIKNKEFLLAKQIIDLNKNFINLYSVDNLLEIIKVYCLYKVRNMLKKLDENKKFSLNKIEMILNEFNLTLSDINLNKNDIILYLEKLNEEYELDSEFKIHKAISQYLLKMTMPTKEDILIYKTYNFLFKEQNESNIQPNMTNVVTLGKYEIFLYLEPGAFFGETALENNFRRNASIRTEEKCFIISLNRELYREIFMEINKRLKLEDVEFICSNYFFSNISPVIFSKYYYSMLILVNKKKNDSIYLQDGKISSIYLLKEGSIKYEIFVSILDINEIIKVLLKNLIKNKKILKIENDVLNDIKKKYILNKKLFNIRNQNQTLNIELRKKYKYDISSCEKYEAMGIIEFFMHMNCIHSCYVSSPQVKLFEINRHSLDKILYNERDILDSYYTLVYSKVISVIKRLNSIETNFINQIEYKISCSNFYFKNGKDNDISGDEISAEIPPNYDYAFSERFFKKFYSPIKYINIKKNYFISKDKNNNTNSNNKLKNNNIQINFNSDSNIRNINKNRSQKLNNISKFNSTTTTTHQNKPFKLKTIKKSLSFGNYFISNKKNKEKDNDINKLSNNKINKDELINLGKSSLSLNKLKHQILLNKEEKIGDCNLLKNSINSIKSAINSIKDNQAEDNNNKNIFLTRLRRNIKKSKDKKMKYNINLYLLENNMNRNNNEFLFPIIPKRKNPIKIKKSSTIMTEMKYNYYDINDSIKELNKEEEHKNIITNKIMNNFNDNNNIKSTGYIGLVNIENNRFIKNK